MTITEMLKRSAKKFPEKTAIAYNDRKISYRKLDAISDRVASYLTGMGISKGDRIGLMIKKSPEAIISFFGVIKAGGVFFPIDYDQTIRGMQYVLDLTNPFGLIVGEDFEHLLSGLKLSHMAHRIIIIGQKENKTFRSWKTVLSRKSVSPLRTEVTNNDIAYLNFTSGTTGVPKAAVATHDNILWNTLSAIESLGLTSDDVHLCLFPIFGHPHELFARPLCLGGTMVLVDSISPKTIVKAICDHKVTCMMAVASIYAALIRFHRSRPFDFSSVRVAESGGMHITPVLRKDFEKELNVSLLPVWGSTETMGIALFTSDPVANAKGAMGKPCPYYEIRVVGEEGHELPPDKIGEMIVSGPAVSRGYFNNLEETEKFIKSGWFFTGDLVKRDVNGYYYFISRKTGMMKVAGMKVFPSEIENVLSSHPKIAEVAVTKIPDSLHGEVPKAVVVLNDGAEGQTKELIDYCKKWLPKYKVPKAIEYVAELPKTSGGKVLYRLL